MDRAAAVDYAKRHWFRPTDDGVVWAKSFAIDVAQRKQEAIAAKTRVQPDWEAVFLRKRVIDRSGADVGEADGLFFVAPAHVGVHHRESEIPIAERFLTQDWFGDAGVPGSDGGLNDCTAYVSHCLVEGGLSYLGPASPGAVWPTRGAQQIHNLLSARPASEVKRLTLMAAAPAVERVLSALAHIVKPADVMTFSAGGRHGHCGMLVSVDATGDAKMTCHSTLDHPDLGSGEGTWQIRTLGTEHPFVSLLHFSHDDPPLGALSSLKGWWKISLLISRSYFLHLAASGAASWTVRKPTGTGAPAKPDGRGYWFPAAGAGVVIVWSNGSVLRVDAPDPQSLVGLEDRWPVVGSRDLT